ncbi:MAG: glycosyltransferase [Candidatus Riflebacteria bacterium]|nr:glycosyltransferase [Candidatus Riflebacteria bacterium]
MNIAFAVSIRKWGGVKTWCIDNGVALKNAGHKVFIYGRPGPFPEKAAELGLEARCCHFGLDFSLLTILFFLREFRRNKIDVCVCNVVKDIRTAGIAARLLGIPIIQHLGDIGDLKNTFKVRLTQRLLAPALVTCSNYCYEELATRVPILREYPFEYIHPGVFPAEKPPETVNKKRVIITTCQLNKAKGHIDLFRALVILRDRGLDFKCIVVGTGTYETEVKNSCRELGLDDLIEFTGYVKSVPEHLARADIFVLPSYCEALGIALEESMAAGLPCVARKSGGVPEIWPPSEFDLLVDKDDRGEEFAAVLGRLLGLSDGDLLEKGLNFYKHAVQAFHREKQARKFEDFIRKATYLNRAC